MIYCSFLKRLTKLVKIQELYILKGGKFLCLFMVHILSTYPINSIGIQVQRLYHGKWQLEDLRVAAGPLDGRYDLVVDLAILAVEGRGQIVGQNDVECVGVLAGRPVDARVARAGSEDVGPRGQVRSVGTAHGALAVARISLFYPAYLGIAADGDVDACKRMPHTARCD